MILQNCYITTIKRAMIIWKQQTEGEEKYYKIVSLWSSWKEMWTYENQIKNHIILSCTATNVVAVLFVSGKI